LGSEGVKMKKYLALVLGVLFVLSFAASAFAIHAEIPSETQAAVAKGTTQITLGGEIRVRGWYRQNLDVFPDADITVPGVGTLKQLVIPTDSNSSSYYDQRVRLSLDAAVSPNVKGYVMLETGGGSNTSDVYTWGNFNSKTEDLRINEAWILYTGSGLLGFNSGLKIGHMPLALGQKEFFDHTKFGDDAIVFFMDPTKQLHIGLLTIKFAGDGQSTFVPFSGAFLGTILPLNLTATGSKFDQTDDLDGYVALMTYKINDQNTIGVNYTYLNLSDLGFSHQNLGVHANGKIGGFGYNVFGDYQFGDADAFDQDFKGYAVGLGLSYNINPVTLRASAAMGSGDDDFGDDEINTFVPYLGADQHYTLIYEYQVTSTAGGLNTGLANTTYGNLGVDWQATKDLGLSLDGYYLRATEDFGADIDQDAGWEVDAKLKYNLSKNLVYQVDAGYFDAGDFYDDLGDLVGGGEAEGVTVLRHSLTLNF
jgi:hypothetical protein